VPTLIKYAATVCGERRMAFEFELEEDFDGPWRDNLDTWVIDIGLGYDTEEDMVVVMSVMLVPGDAFLKDELSHVFDLQFGIRRKWADRTSPPDFDKETGRKYIPPERNADVLRVIQRAVIQLVGVVNPDHLTMESYHPNLEPKALRKYQALCDGLTDAGYELVKAFQERSNGINYWYLRRRVE
jgi:hypothetical protein